MRTSYALNRVSLARAISKLGLASRSQAFKEIQKGIVAVNGAVELNPYRWIDLKKDRITLHGRTVSRKVSRTIVFNKPINVITTVSDEKGRETIYDVLGPDAQELLPVGRLDKETTGLLLLTSDHRLAEFLTNPTSHVEKTYIVRVDRKLRREDLNILAEGVEIQLDGKSYKTKPARCRPLNPVSVEISITEGKNRQVRKMFESLGYEVRSLHRTAIGPLKIGELKIGQSRPMTEEELRSLRQMMFGSTRRTGLPRNAKKSGARAEQ